MKSTTIKKIWDKPKVDVLAIKEFTHGGPKTQNNENSKHSPPTS